MVLARLGYKRAAAPCLVVTLCGLGGPGASIRFFLNKLSFQAMEPSETKQDLTRRVWILRHSDGKEMKFEVRLTNPKMREAQATMRQLANEREDVEVWQRDE
jgi:hypothetical protein